jgi:toxin YoeB
MTTAFTDHGWEDWRYWETNDQGTLARIMDLVKEIHRDPFHGDGKPEPVRGDIAGYWSRRITGDHRLVYRVSAAKPLPTLIIIQARFHYHEQ